MAKRIQQINYNSTRHLDNLITESISARGIYILGERLDK